MADKKAPPPKTDTQKTGDTRYGSPDADKYKGGDKGGNKGEK